MNKKLAQIEKEVIHCTQCPGLATYIREVGEKKVKRYRNETYWARPVPGFGDPDPKLVIIGLAPGAHGANRTGRMFTGDSSGDWLYRALYETGFATQPESEHKDDGLQLKEAFVTAPVRCAPPQNKPTAEEIRTCTPYLARELASFKNVKTIICLGGIGFKAYCSIAGLKGLKFGHHHRFDLGNGVRLISSYHPSRQNTNTGRLLWDSWLAVFQEARRTI